MRNLMVIIMLLIFSLENIIAQSITGDTIVCPGTSHIYQIGEDTCTLGISNITWQATSNSGVTIGGSTSNVIIVTWDAFSSGATSGTLSVSYNCYFLGTDNSVDTSIVETEIDIEILSLQQPLFTFSSITLSCNNDSILTIVTPDQGGVAGNDVFYAWTYPECFDFDGGSSTGVFTADKATSGEICLSVSIPSCNVNTEECFIVTRECDDYVTYNPLNPILESYTSCNIEIKTIGAVTNSGFEIVEFKAGHTINLGPGFLGVPNFIAHIAPCTCYSGDSSGCYKNATYIFSNNKSNSQKNDSPFSYKKNMLFATNIITEISVFPNPTNGLTTVEIKNFDELKTYSLQLFNAMGGLIKTIDVTNNKTDIDLSSFQNGIYLLSVNDGQTVNVLRISKTN